MTSSKSRSLLGVCVASAMLAASTPTSADPSHDPAITEAHAEGGVLHILGRNLGGGKPKVTLGMLPLSVVSMTARQIDALIPATVEPGSYLLSVALARSGSGDDGKYEEFWVTLGAAGPQGPQGIAGPVGAQGPAGSDGAIASFGTFVVHADRHFQAGDPDFVSIAVQCPAGSFLTGGAAESTIEYSILESAPDFPTPNGWRAMGELRALSFPSPSGSYIRAYAICLQVN